DLRRILETSGTEQTKKLRRSSVSVGVAIVIKTPDGSHGCIETAPLPEVVLGVGVDRKDAAWLSSCLCLPLLLP
ncbi:MAG TPA: hypothetical protein VKP30_21345, partial [Polyangiaceae bacterium]|nr:hypothetical protein [Polyangiaceae bacterium]